MWVRLPPRAPIYPPYFSSPYRFPSIWCIKFVQAFLRPLPPPSKIVDRIPRVSSTRIPRDDRRSCVAIPVVAAVRRPRARRDEQHPLCVDPPIRRDRRPELEQPQNVRLRLGHRHQRETLIVARFE